jgi:hypothetical protein
MPLDAQIVDSVTGQIDPELSAHIDTEEHAVFFAHVGQQPSRFPLLMRMRDYYADAEYTTEEMEPLIAEIEKTAGLFDSGSRVYRFTEPFHSMCVMAFLRKKGVALFAD